MENKLEQLLNSLIEKGWKPFGTKYDLFVWNTNSSKWWFRWQYAMTNWDNAYDYFYEYFYPRQIVSKESWLWQFVCENGMVKEGHKHERILDPTFWEWWADCKRQEHDWNYWYRLIESALKDESKLKDFLLQNIRVWNED